MFKVGDKAKYIGVPGHDTIDTYDDAAVDILKSMIGKIGTVKQLYDDLHVHGLSVLRVALIDGSEICHYSNRFELVQNLSIEQKQDNASIWDLMSE